MPLNGWKINIPNTIHIRGKAMRSRNNEIMMDSGIESSISIVSFETIDEIDIFTVNSFANSICGKCRFGQRCVQFSLITLHDIASIPSLRWTEISIWTEKREKPNANLIVSRHRLVEGERKKVYWMRFLSQLHSTHDSEISVQTVVRAMPTSESRNILNHSKSRNKFFFLLQQRLEVNKRQVQNWFKFVAVDGWTGTNSTVWN